MKEDAQACEPCRQLGGVEPQPATLEEGGTGPRHSALFYFAFGPQ